MSITLSTFRDKIKRKAQDLSLDNTDLDLVLNGALSDFRVDYKIRGSRRRGIIKVYPNVNEYALPIQTGETETDFETLVDLQEWFEGDTANNSNFRKVSQSVFAQKDTNGYTDPIAERYINGQKMILVNYTPTDTTEVLMHDCDTYNGNGTWTAVGDATNITTDENTYVQGAGSINFDIVSSTLTAGLYVDSMASVDLDDYENAGSFFVFVYIPDATNIAGQTMTFRWGNSASVYWSDTATTQHNGQAFTNGWNLVRFDWGGATETGTVDNTAIDYLYYTFSYSSTPSLTTDFRLDGIYFRTGLDMNLEYYSNKWVRTGADVWQEEFSTITDYFGGTTDEAYCLLDKALEKLFTEIIIDDLKSEKFRASYEKKLRNIKSLNPEETKNRGTTWYPEF